jgi:hypothetical protein
MRGGVATLVGFDGGQQVIARRVGSSPRTAGTTYLG